MPDLNMWAIGDASPISETARAASAWRRILDRPTVITTRDHGDQTVRIEYDDTADEENDMPIGSQRSNGLQRVVVFGVRNHPTVPDTILHRKDRFGIEEQDALVSYEVISVIYAPGEIQALCEAKS